MTESIYIIAVLIIIYQLVEWENKRAEAKREKEKDVWETYNEKRDIVFCSEIQKYKVSIDTDHLGYVCIGYYTRKFDALKAYEEDLQMYLSGGWRYQFLFVDK